MSHATDAIPPPLPPALRARDSLRDALRSARRWRELISETERRRLLADIAAVALAIGQDLYGERGVNDLDVAAAARSDDPCPRERLAFLRAAWPRVAGALNGIESAPHVDLVSGPRPVPPERARRVRPLALLAALRAGDLAPAPPEHPLAARLGGHLPRRVTEMVAAPRFDTTENRAVKTCLAHFARDLASVGALAANVGAPEVAADAEALRARIRRHLRRPPWRDLPLPAASAPVLTPTLRAHPHYRLVYDTYRRYRRAFRFDWDHPVFTLPARETWLLYEYWGFFQTAAALRDLGWRASGGTAAHMFALQRSGLTFALAKGHTSRLEFANADGTRRLTVTYNREFGRASSRAGDPAGWRSRSHAMRPDITIERDGRLLVLDPKFKTYARTGWEADDVHQMHAYRDAIVRGGDGAGEGDRGVAAAWLLYAGRISGENRPVIAYPRATASRPFGTGRVGAVLLRPGEPEGAAALRGLLRAFLEGPFTDQPSGS